MEEGVCASCECPCRRERNGCFKKRWRGWTVALLLGDSYDNRDLSPLPQLKRMSEEETSLCGCWKMPNMLKSGFLVCSAIIVSCPEVKDVKVNTSSRVLCPIQTLPSLSNSAKNDSHSALQLMDISQSRQTARLIQMMQGCTS